MELFDESGEVEQAYLKTIFYGGPKAGKTFTALQVATMLGRTAVVDTERGVEPYRPLFKNPDGTPFLVAKTRDCEVVTNQCIDEALRKKCICIIIDQITTIWDDRKDLYIVREYEKQSRAWQAIERNGKLPFHAWSFIKGPYRKMINQLLDAPMHVFLIARQADKFEVKGDGEPVKLGERADAEKNTQYEPAVVVRMEYIEKRPGVPQELHRAYVEGDRWHTLGGQVFDNPDAYFLDPIIAKLGKVHGRLPECPVPDIKPPGPKEGQRKLIKMLAEKGGVEKERVEEELEKMSQEEAAALINSMTKNDYSWFEKKEV